MALKSGTKVTMKAFPKAIRQAVLELFSQPQLVLVGKVTKYSFKVYISERLLNLFLRSHFLIIETILRV